VYSEGKQKRYVINWPIIDGDFARRDGVRPNPANSHRSPQELRTRTHRETFQLGALKVQDRKIQDWKKRGTENAGLEKSGLENVGPNRRGGKGGTGKRGNIMCMGSEM